MRAVSTRCALLAAVLLVPSLASAESVTGCGQTVSGASVLTADLDCTGRPGPAVNISSGSLALNGFSIKGGMIGINCERKCKISGPGTVSEANIGINAYGVLKLRDVDATDNKILGVQCFTGCSVSGGTISNTGVPGESLGHGITSTAVLKLDDVTITGNLGNGVQVGNYPQPRGKVQARNTTVTGNGNGIVADKGVGLLSCTVTGNSQLGVSVGEPGCPTGGKLLAKASTITGNGTDGDCGTTLACADLASCRAPNVVGSSCDTSYVVDSGVPGSDWDVCASD